MINSGTIERQDSGGAAPRLQVSVAAEPDSAALEAIWRASRNPYSECHPGWARLAAQNDGSALRAFTTERDGRIDSYAMIGEGWEDLHWLLGYFRIHTKRIARLCVINGQSFAPGLTPDECRERARELLAWLAREAKGRPVYLQGTPTDSPLLELVRAKEHRFRVVAHGRPHAHFAIDLPGSSAAFYEGLGYKTRKSLRYSARRLEREMGGDVIMKCFRTPDEVDPFLDDAMDISRKTHQYLLLHSGLRNREWLTAAFGRMAERGWWQGYILYCKGEPAAFIWGYQVEDIFYYYNVGYDPKWREWSVGSVAMVKFIEMLIAAADRPRRLDLLYGDPDYKRRVSNCAWEDINLYLFPRTLKMFVTSYSLHFVNTVTDWVSQMLERYNLRSRVIRLLRRRAVGA